MSLFDEYLRKICPDKKVGENEEGQQSAWEKPGAKEWPQE